MDANIEGLETENARLIGKVTELESALAVANAELSKVPAALAGRLALERQLAQMKEQLAKTLRELEFSKHSSAGFVDLSKKFTSLNKVVSGASSNLRNASINQPHSKAAADAVNMAVSTALGLTTQKILSQPVHREEEANAELQSQLDQLAAARDTEVENLKAQVINLEAAKTALETQVASAAREHLEMTAEDSLLKNTADKLEAERARVRELSSRVSEFAAESDKSAALAKHVQRLEIAKVTLETMNDKASKRVIKSTSRANQAAAHTADLERQVLKLKLYNLKLRRRVWAEQAAKKKAACTETARLERELDLCRQRSGMAAEDSLHIERRSELEQRAGQLQADLVTCNDFADNMRNKLIASLAEKYAAIAECAGMAAQISELKSELSKVHETAQEGLKKFQYSFDTMKTQLSHVVTAVCEKKDCKLKELENALEAMQHSLATHRHLSLTLFGSTYVHQI